MANNHMVTIRFEEANSVLTSTSVVALAAFPWLRFIRHRYASVLAQGAHKKAPRSPNQGFLRGSQPLLTAAAKKRESG
jgi:hypothetical protein